MGALNPHHLPPSLRYSSAKSEWDVIVHSLYDCAVVYIRKHSPLWLRLQNMVGRRHSLDYGLTVILGLPKLESREARVQFRDGWVLYQNSWGNNDQVDGYVHVIIYQQNRKELVAKLLLLNNSL